MSVRIYQPAKSAMQSGRDASDSWQLEFVRHDRATPDMLMGWPSSSDTTHSVKLSFPSIEAAIAYAENHGLDYHVVKPSVRTAKIKAYADNFASRRREAWTH